MTAEQNKLVGGVDAARLLDVTRGAFGIESSIDWMLRLLFLRRCEMAIWDTAVKEVYSGGPSIMALSAHGTTRMLEGLGWFPEPMSVEQRRVIDALVLAVDSIPSDAMPALFEECLSLRQHRVGRSGQELAAPTWLSELEVALARPIGGSVHDFACGFGGGLLVAARAGAKSLSGTDVNLSAILIAGMRLAIHGHEAYLRTGDSLREPLNETVDRIVGDPPFGMRFDDGQLMRWEGLIRHSDSTGPWLAAAVDGLSPGGLAVIQVASVAALRSGVLHRMLSDGTVEAVVQLPPGANPGTKISTALVVLGKTPSTRSDVLALDLTSLFEADGQAGMTLRPKSIELVATTMQSWRNGDDLQAAPHIALLVSRADIEAEGFRPSFAPAPEVPVSWPEPPIRLVDRLRISNMKALAGTHTVPLAPLTLLYGPNSVGKSSVMQAILLLAQSLRVGSFAANGDLARLGTFAGLVNGHDTDLTLALGLDFGIIPPWPRPQGSLHPSLVRQVDVEIITDGGSGGRVGGVGFGVSGRPGLRVLNDETDTWTVDVDSLDGWVGLLDEQRAAFIDPRRRDAEGGKSYKRLAGALRKLRRMPEIQILGQGEGFLPQGVIVPPTGAVTIDPGQMLQQRLTRAMTGINEELERFAETLIYLGPIRPAPQRFMERVSYRDKAVAVDYASYLFDNKSAVVEVNEWLSRLGIPYSMDVLQVTAGGSASAVGDLIAVVLTDQRSGVTVSPADVGYGVSQVLPIVVQCLQASERMICIEQPELHLHPRLQANLGELLVEATKPSGAANQIVAETHSEHILLRVQRLVREGQVTPQDVAVLYVDQDESGKASVWRLRLGPQGEFLDPWPTGFFDDSLQDVMGGWE